MSSVENSTQNRIRNMGRSPCCSKVGLKRGPWSPKEDSLLSGYVQQNGEGQWRSLPKKAGLLRCGKSCRLRWMNYLRPGIVRGNITEDEEDLIVRLHSLLGNRWSLIAGRLPGRTDNEIKNYWNTHLLKKLNDAGVNPVPHRDLPKMKKPQQQEKIRVKKDASGRRKVSAATASPTDKQDEITPAPKTTVYLPKALRFSPGFSRSNSYDSLVSGASSVRAVEWPPLFETDEVAAYGVYISGGGEDFLGGEYGCLPVVSQSDSMSDDVEMMKFYDEYFQLL